MRLPALLLAGLLPVIAQAQDFPNKPIKMVVPYAPGGLPDTMTRIIGPKMSESLGQQIVVENRPGAGGISGTEVVARRRRSAACSRRPAGDQPASVQAAAL